MLSRFNARDKFNVANAFNVPTAFNRVQNLSSEGEAGAWTPSQISTLIWLDGADANTIIHSGGAVSQWNDKSGNARHVSQVAGAKQPIYTAGQYLTFDEVDDTLSIATTAMRMPVLTVLGVINNRAVGTDSNKSWACYEGGSNPDFWATARNGGIAGMANHMADSSNPSISSASTFGSPFIYAGKSPTATIAQYIRVDGTQTNGSTSASTVAELGTNFVIGRQKNNVERYFGGDVHEVIIGGDMSISDVQKIEGYLAWKWGLEANLPVYHPYKNSAPTV
jgi:hypothetical protein